MTQPYDQWPDKDLFNEMSANLTAAETALAKCDLIAAEAVARVKAQYPNDPDKIEWVGWVADLTTTTKDSAVTLHVKWGKFATYTAPLSSYMGSK